MPGAGFWPPPSPSCSMPRMHASSLRPDLGPRARISDSVGKEAGPGRRPRRQTEVLGLRYRSESRTLAVPIVVALNNHSPQRTALLET